MILFILNNMNYHTHISKNSFPSQDYNLWQNWVEIDASAIAHNAAQFQQWLGKNTLIAGVIKSNAYGHGLIEIAQIYDQCKDIAALCTINLSEAMTIRQKGIQKTILVIGYLDAHYDAIALYDIQVAVYNLDIVHALDHIGFKYQKQIKVHIKVDTGMSRLGVTLQELDPFIDAIKKLSWISIVGIFSHLAQGYDQQRAQQQESLFTKAMQKNLITHLANSHGSLLLTQQYNFARIGIGLYGYLQKHDTEKQKLLRPALSLKARILQIKRVVTGTKIGYDGMFQADKDMTIATISIGYHEGLDARLSNCGFVIVNDQYAPIIGRVCMNLTIIDISSIANCTTDQIVTILGKELHTSIFAHDWSAITQASAYNHLTKISPLIPRIVINP